MVKIVLDYYREELVEWLKFLHIYLIKMDRYNQWTIPSG